MYSFLPSASDSFVTLNPAAMRALTTKASSLLSKHPTLITIWLQKSGSNGQISSADHHIASITRDFPKNHRSSAYRPEKRSRSHPTLRLFGFWAFVCRLFTPLRRWSLSEGTAQFAWDGSWWSIGLWLSCSVPSHAFGGILLVKYGFDGLVSCFLEMTNARAGKVAAVGPLVSKLTP